MTRTGLSDTLKREPSESVGDKSPRANRRVLRTSRTGAPNSKKGELMLSFFTGDPYGTRTHVTTVKGWCLNRLTNGPKFAFIASICKRIASHCYLVAAMRFELMTYRVWTDRSNQLSYAAIWLRGQDSNLRPSGYEPDELPSCSTPRYRKFYVLRKTAYL